MKNIKSVKLSELKKKLARALFKYMIINWTERSKQSHGCDGNIKARTCVRCFLIFFGPQLFP